MFIILGCFYFYKGLKKSNYIEVFLILNNTEENMDNDIWQYYHQIIET